MVKFVEQLRNWKMLIIALAAIMVVGLIGFIVPYGDEKWNFIFESMMWFPVEIGVTIFIIDKIIKKNNEKTDKFREFSQYYSIANEDLQSMIKSIKIQLISAVTNSQVENEEVDSKFDDVCINLKNYVSIEKLREGFQAPVVDKSDFFKSITNPQYQRKSFFQSLPEASLIILPRIEKHLSLFLRYIPVDLFKNLYSVQKILDSHIFFTGNQNLSYARTALLQREAFGQMIDSDYQQVIDLLVSFYEDIYQIVNTIETLIKENTNEISR